MILKSLLENPHYFNYTIISFFIKKEIISLDNLGNLFSTFVEKSVFFNGHHSMFYRYQHRQLVGPLALFLALRRVPLSVL